jgi:hypothetical protein
VPAMQRRNEESGAAVRLRVAAGFCSLCLLLAWGLTSRSDAAGSPGRFCSGPLGESRIHAVERMASIRRIPAGGELPLGSGLRLVLKGHREPPLGRAFGYRVQLPPGRLTYRLRARRGALTNIAVRTSVFAVDRRGREIGLVRRRSYTPSTRRQLAFTSGRLDRLGFFRFDIGLLAGNRRARYSEYVRLLKPKFRGELRLEHDRVEPSDWVAGRLVNTGTTSFQFGYPFGLQRSTDGEWTPVPIGDLSPWPLVLKELRPGQTSNCFRFQVPLDARTGVYRVQQLVKPAFTGKRRSHPVRAYFRVTGIARGSS